MGKTNKESFSLTLETGLGKKWGINRGRTVSAGLGYPNKSNIQVRINGTGRMNDFFCFKLLFIKPIVPIGNKTCLGCVLSNTPVVHTSAWKTRSRTLVRTLRGIFSCFRLTTTKVRFWMFGSSKLWSVFLCIWNITCWCSGKTNKQTKI